MKERGAAPSDVLEAMLTSTQAVHDPPDEKWKALGGVDLDGDKLTVVVVLNVHDESGFVVTVF